MQTEGKTKRVSGKCEMKDRTPGWAPWSFVGDDFWGAFRNTFQNVSFHHRGTKLGMLRTPRPTIQCDNSTKITTPDGSWSIPTGHHENPTRLLLLLLLWLVLLLLLLLILLLPHICCIERSCCCVSHAFCSLLWASVVFMLLCWTQKPWRSSRAGTRMPIRKATRFFSNVLLWYVCGVLNLLHIDPLIEPFNTCMPLESDSRVDGRCRRRWPSTHIGRIIRTTKHINGNDKSS